jgi:hypothetical protein
MDNFPLSNPEVWVTLIIRGTNAILWTIVFFQMARSKQTAYLSVRRLVMSVVFLGMWVLVIGALTSLGIVETGTARMIYTIFTAYAAIVAAGILLGPWHKD